MVLSTLRRLFFFLNKKTSEIDGGINAQSELGMLLYEACNHSR